MSATFTVLIGVLGRPTLKHTLDSIARQARQPGDQCLVVVDTFEQGARPDVLELVASYGDGFHAAEFGERGARYGTPQINYALENFPITGSHLLTIGDDDVFVDGAYSHIRELCDANPGRPILWRFLSPWRQVLWDKPRMKMSHISGCCIAAPRQFCGVMPEVTPDGKAYPEHDFDWMQAILARSPDPVWLDDVLVIARPPVRGTDVAHQPLVRCGHCSWWAHGEDVSWLLQRYCLACGAVLPLRSRIAVAV